MWTPWNVMAARVRGARECAVMGQAVTLARWIGSGRRPVTAGQVLRKADVPAAGAALRVDVPARLRTMAAANPASSELRDDGDVEDGVAAADLPAADEAPSPGRPGFRWSG